jgi:hypothetical protein
VKQSVTAILEADSASKLEELEALSGAWDGEALVVSKYDIFVVLIMLGIFVLNSL